MDRSTKATLSTYNTWIQISRLQKIYHFHCLKLELAPKPLAVGGADLQLSRDLMLGMVQSEYVTVRTVQPEHANCTCTCGCVMRSSHNPQSHKALSMKNMSQSPVCKALLENSPGQI